MTADARSSDAVRVLAEALASRPDVGAREVVAIRDALELADSLHRAAAGREDARRRLRALRPMVRRPPLPPRLLAAFDRARSWSHSAADMFDLDSTTLEAAAHLLPSPLSRSRRTSTSTRRSSCSP